MKELIEAYAADKGAFTITADEAGDGAKLTRTIPSTEKTETAGVGDVTEFIQDTKRDLDQANEEVTRLKALLKQARAFRRDILAAMPSDAK